jgi:hypothetical protein
MVAALVAHVSPALHNRPIPQRHDDGSGFADREVNGGSGRESGWTFLRAPIQATDVAIRRTGRRGDPWICPPGAELCDEAITNCPVPMRSPTSDGGRSWRRSEECARSRHRPADASEVYRIRLMLGDFLTVSGCGETCGAAPPAPPTAVSSVRLVRGWTRSKSSSALLAIPPRAAIGYLLASMRSPTYLVRMRPDQDWRSRQPAVVLDERPRLLRGPHDRRRAAAPLFHQSA